jgi:UDP-N-acetylenolpyruvoylglucosamine reductase
MISSDLKDNYEVNIWERFIGLPGTIGAAIAGNA